MSLGWKVALDAPCYIRTAVPRRLVHWVFNGAGCVRRKWSRHQCCRWQWGTLGHRWDIAAHYGVRGREEEMSRGICVESVRLINSMFFAEFFFSCQFSHFPYTPHCFYFSHSGTAFCVAVVPTEISISITWINNDILYRHSWCSEDSTKLVILWLFICRIKFSFIPWKTSQHLLDDTFLFTCIYGPQMINPTNNVFSSSASMMFTFVVLIEISQIIGYWS